MSATRRYLIRELQKSNFDTDLKKFFDEMNKVRTDPKSMIPELEATVKKFRGNMLGNMRTNEGAGAYLELIKFLKNQKPLSPMTWSNGMANACQKFVDKAGPSGAVGHSVPGGGSMSERINAEGKWSGGAGENLAYGDRDGKNSLIQLMVDDGVASRGHRNNLFNEGFKIIGIAIGEHKNYRYMTCNDFAGGFKSSQDANPKFTWKGGSGSSSTSTPSKPRTKPAKPTTKPTTKSAKPTTKTTKDDGKGNTTWTRPGKNGGVEKGWTKKNADGSSSGGSSWSSGSSSGSGKGKPSWDNWEW